jgi:hypothetical protein
MKILSNAFPSQSPIQASGDTSATSLLLELFIAGWHEIAVRGKSLECVFERFRYLIPFLLTLAQEAQ